MVHMVQGTLTLVHLGYTVVPAILLSYGLFSHIHVRHILLPHSNLRGYRHTKVTYLCTMV